MRFLIFTFMFMASFALPALAQSDLSDIELIKGRLINGEDSTAAAFVHIINHTLQQGTTSDEQGVFKIYAQTGDTLVFSGVQFIQDTLVLNKLPEEGQLMQLGLQPATLVMDEIEINELPPLDVFKQQVLDYRPEQEEKIHIPGSYNGPRKEYDFGKGGPFSLVAGLFSNEIKEFRKLKKLRAKEGRNKAIERKYNRKFISRITTLEGQLLDEFMIYCDFSEDFLFETNEYELIVAVQKKLQRFKEEKNLKPDGMPLLENDSIQRG